MRLRLAQWFCRISVVALASFLPAAASGANNTIVVGQAIDLSGPNGSIGRDYVAGIKTFFDAVNSVGGINGKRVHYIVRDDQGQADAAVDAIAGLIESDQVDYLLGGVGDSVVQAVLDTPTFRRSDHVLFAPLVTADLVDRQRVLYWRPSYKQELRHIFSHFSRLGVKNPGVVYQETPLNERAFRGLSSELAQSGMKLVATARIGGNAERAAAEAARMAGLRPDFVIVVADTISTALFLKEFRIHAPRTFVAGTSLSNLITLRELAGPKTMEWTIFSQVVPDPRGNTSLLQLEHRAMMNKYRDEDVSSLTLEGFAVAKSLAKAIEQLQRPFRNALKDLITHGRDIDLGGLAVSSSAGTPHLSSYLDIALMRKGNDLMF